MRAVGNPGPIRWRFLVANYHGVNSVPGCSVGYLMGEQFCGLFRRHFNLRHTRTHMHTHAQMCGVWCVVYA